MKTIQCHEGTEFDQNAQKHTVAEQADFENLLVASVILAPAWAFLIIFMICALVHPILDGSVVAALRAILPLILFLIGPAVVTYGVVDVWRERCRA